MYCLNRLLLYGIILVIAVLGLYLLSTTLQKQEDLQNPSETTQDVLNQINSDTNAETSDISDYGTLPSVLPCEQQTGWNKDNCYRDEALGSVDEKICQNISDEGAKNSCIIAVATDKIDITLCDLMPNQRAKNWCIETVAVDNDERSFCEKIVDVGTDTMKERCIAQTNIPCEEITVHADKDSCYQDKALYQSDETICQKISDAATKNKCITNIAVANADTTLCSSIQNSDEKDQCILNVAIENVNADFCQQISGSKAKQDCIQQTSA